MVLVLEFEKIYLKNLPSAEMYEKSYMHRDVISHVVVTPHTDFIVTARFTLWPGCQHSVIYILMLQCRRPSEILEKDGRVGRIREALSGAFKYVD